MRPGMIPIFAFPGEITPGQFGPTSRDFDLLTTLHTLTMSLVGMPSVMQIISGRPASSASRMASAANGGGTKMTVALAPVFSTAWATVSKTGQPSCTVPPLPGVTPPTTLVPYSAQPLAWNVPSLPVIPCTISRVFSSTSTDIDDSRSLRPLFRGCDYLGRRVFHGFPDDEVQAGVLQNLAPLLHIRSLQAEDHGNFYIRFLSRFHHAGRQRIDAQNAAEDVDEDCLHILIGKQNLERVLNLLLVRATAYIEEVRG